MAVSGPMMIELPAAAVLHHHHHDDHDDDDDDHDDHDDDHDDCTLPPALDWIGSNWCRAVTLPLPLQSLLRLLSRQR